jgi:C_GCAxxG_C_C family probable redox protein
LIVFYLCTLFKGRDIVKRRRFLKNCTVGVSAVIGSCAGACMTSEGKTNPATTIDSDRLQQSALDHFLKYDRTCCESILMAGCEALGVQNDLVPDIALGLAGGVGLQGDTCGVLTSSAMVLSVAVGSTETDYSRKKKRTLQAVGQVSSAFKKRFGCTDCRTLSGLDLTTAEDRKRLVEEVKAQKCAKFVSAAAELLARQLQSTGKGTES